MADAAVLLVLCRQHNADGTPPPPGNAATAAAAFPSAAAAAIIAAADTHTRTNLRCGETER
jgi:hypothetical protein